MSARISVVFISFALLSFFVVSCTARDEVAASVFDTAFKASLRVTVGQGDYSADVALKARDDGTDGSRSNGRDGSIEYTHPDSVVGITAVREGGEVCVNVCGVNVKPSEKVAERYVFLMDILDVRPEQVISVNSGEYEGKRTTELLVENDCGRYTVILEGETLTPILLKGEEVKIEFESFVLL